MSTRKNMSTQQDRQPSWPGSRINRSRRHWTVTLLGAAALVAPVAVAGPSEAASHVAACTAQPPTSPIVVGLGTDGRKVVSNRVTVACSEGSEVQVEVVPREQDPGRDDFAADQATDTHPYRLSWVFVAKGESTFRYDYSMSPLDSGRWNQVYHSVRFRVRNISTGVISPWTSWQQSPVNTILS